LLFTVSDTGTGIPAAIRERIFDPFFTTKGPEKGTGLGLSTVLGIVRSHGGFIVLQTEEGKGTRFLVHLPVAGDGVAEQPQTEVALQLPDCRGKRLLVVDDEENVRTMVARVFAGSGFEVVPACDGAEALERLNAPGARFDLVLLDMTMPNLGGREVLQRLGEQGPRVPTVAMSGNFERQDRRGCASAAWRRCPSLFTAMISCAARAPRSAWRLSRRQHLRFCQGPAARAGCGAVSVLAIVLPVFLVIASVWCSRVPVHRGGADRRAQPAHLFRGPAAYLFPASPRRRWWRARDDHLRRDGRRDAATLGIA
jgi:CheY-like chemotaxis protein